MLLLKILIGIVIYIAIGFGTLALIVRYDEDSFDPDFIDGSELVSYVFVWPLLGIFYICETIFKHYREFLKKLYDKNINEDTFDDEEEDADDEF